MIVLLLVLQYGFAALLARFEGRELVESGVPRRIHNYARD
jgi:hypothetical protein